MAPKSTESALENAALDWFGELGWATAFGPDLAPGGSAQERDDYGQVVLVERLRAALARVNPGLPAVAIDEAVRKLRRLESPSLIESNRAMHRLFTDGVDVSWMGKDRQQHGKVWVFDLGDLGNNDWLVVNQFTVVENPSSHSSAATGKHERRPDLVVFVNGLPLAVFELKNPAAENATIKHAFNQLQTYKGDIPSLFVHNEVLAISDGLAARHGTLTAGWDRFMPWRAPSPLAPLPGGEGDSGFGASLPVGETGVRGRSESGAVALEVLVRGLFDRRRFLDYVLNFVTFEDDGGDSTSLAKKAAAYHPYHAVNKAVAETLRATGVADATAPSPLAPLPGGEGKGKAMDGGKGEGSGTKEGGYGQGEAIRLDGDWDWALAAEEGDDYHYRGGFSFAGLKELARGFRQEETRAEELVWECLRDRRMLGAKFRRQHQIGPYVADFFCAEKCLVLELDGPVHDVPEQEKHDHKRDAYLRSLGNTVVRVSNDFVLNSTGAFLDRLRTVLTSPPSLGEGTPLSSTSGTRAGGILPSTSGTRAGGILPSTSGRGAGGEGYADRRIGVVWHTQGSGKSLSMVFFAGKVIRHPGMANPTIVVITDRNDLDEQLFGTFAANRDLLRQTPVQAEDRQHLRQLLKVVSGGVVFTTIQKFLPDAKGDSYPQLSARRNIVVIADEAHRSQYDFIDGFARHMHDALPNASFIGFTGTPIENDDRSTPAVFGNYIDTYDILQAVEDGATVPIYYESRLARIVLAEAEKPSIDPAFEEITEGEEEDAKQRLRTKWAALEAMVGTEKRIGLLAADLVEHFEQRLAGMDGKGMIVCMSRRICVEMYDAIVKLRPAWHTGNDATGAVKVVMSGSASDHKDWQPHIRAKSGREALAKRFKDPADPLRLVIVRDMWLTGFDAPCLHTMYVDKPMHGHGLMQAIARVNRVFRDKPGGLVVDYLGLADSLRRALANYTGSGGRGNPAHTQDEAVKVMQERIGILRDMLHGFDYAPLILARGIARLQAVASAMDFVLSLEDGKQRFLAGVSGLSKAFALAVPHESALAIRDEVGFLQEIRAGLVKITVVERGQSNEDVEVAVRQLVAKSVAPQGVVDIFAAAGLGKPDISILSDSFLEDVKRLPQRNLALELLRRLLNDEIKARHRKNVVQARSFAEMLEEAVRKYTNRALSAAEVIEELIKLAHEMREAQRRGEELGLTDDEVAFFDALGVNDGAVAILGDETLKTIAQELVLAVRRSVTIDWTVREAARAQIRVIVKRILRRYGYPPDKQAKATELVLEQAEVLCKEWVA
ncbi:MAG: HsdR family type I site-specific deoxyribonuclease [Lentisphaeria bacterium]|jgi:type I restriction enzyme R subunit|nr:HsdR family type I site-specific deoxyribonuclease [Lentisphaeria bacterium]